MNVYLYVLNTMADWEIANISAELYSGRFLKKGRVNIQKIAQTLTPVTSMGGMSITADLNPSEVTFSEGDLLILLSNLKPDIRIQGNDWDGKAYTGRSLNIPIHYHDRNSHSFSSSSLRMRVIEAQSPKLSE